MTSSSRSTPTVVLDLSRMECFSSSFSPKISNRENDNHTQKLTVYIETRQSSLLVVKSEVKVTVNILTCKYFCKASLYFPWLWSSFPWQIRNTYIMCDDANIEDRHRQLWTIYKINVQNIIESPITDVLINPIQQNDYTNNLNHTRVFYKYINVSPPPPLLLI